MRRSSGMRVAAMVALAAGVATVSLAGEGASKASFLDAGIEAGMAKRSLSDTKYDWGFAWQLHAELALLPPILMVGPYATFARPKPSIDDKSGVPGNISFITVGMRAKVKIPIPGPITPYGVAGIGIVHANFPQYVLQECQQGVCGSTQVPNANANFVEFLLGAGVMYTVAGPLALTAEFDWRPTTGYKNDQYQTSLNSAAANGQQPGAPSPSRNGVSYTAMLGAALSF